MNFLPRSQFDQCVSEQAADKYSKGFTSWNLLVAMVYAQLSGTRSLRTLEASFNSQPVSHRRKLGLNTLHRSTLADALAKRSTAPFSEMAQFLMSGVTARIRREGKKLLYLLDSTAITLKGLGFDNWTQTTKTSRTQGIKWHVLTGMGAPVHYRITPANVNDITEATKFPIEAGATYVFDKGYCDYTWWNHISNSQAKFVTRFKRNANLRIVKQRPRPKTVEKIILADEVVQFANKHPGGGRKNPYRQPLRRITVARPGNTPLILSTNDLRSKAIVIAEHYKQRWGIELFFKWVKQHLQIKSFLGRSATAVCFQILAALITHLLLILYRDAVQSSQSLWILLTELRATLFQYSATFSLLRRRRKSQPQEVTS